MLDFGEDLVQPWLSTAPLEPPLTSLHPLTHLPSTGEAQLGQNMPCRGMACHSPAHSLSGHFQQASPCQSLSSHSPEPDQTKPRPSLAPQRAEIAVPSGAQTRPCTRQSAHGIHPGRARTSAARSPRVTSTLHLSPVHAPGRQQARRHDRLTAGTPWPSSSSTRRATGLQALVDLAIAAEPRLRHDHAC
jgi:hypothetical protein